MTTFSTSGDSGRVDPPGVEVASESGSSLLQVLDALSEKVEMARATIVKLREDNEELRVRCDGLRERLSRYEASGSPDDIERSRAEIERIVHERDSLLQERGHVAERVRGILERVEALEGLA